MKSPTSQNCISCRLWESCKSPGLRPIVDTRASTQKENTILVIGDYTEGSDDVEGTYFYSGGRNYKLIEGLLNSLEVRYVFTTAVACSLAPNSKDINKKQLANCFDEKLKPLILKYKPRAIITLGKTAMNAVFQDKAPKSIASIAQTGMELEVPTGEVNSDGSFKDDFLNCLVIPLEHPTQFWRQSTDKMKLAKQYQNAFQKAERYCKDSEKRTPVEFELVTNLSRFYELATKMPVEFSFDIENKHSNKDLNKNTIWKKNSDIICLSVTYEEVGSKYRKTFVVGNELVKDKLCVEKLFKDRVACAHNISHDAQGIWRYCGVNIFDFVKDFDDTLALFYLTDQNRTFNGLKDLSTQYLNIENYQHKVQRYVKAANADLSQRRKLVTKKLKEIKNKIKWFKEASEWKHTQLKVSYAKKKKYNEVLNEYSSLEELNELYSILEKQIRNMPPEDSCDYGDIPLIACAEYNAEDTLATYKLWKDIIPFLSKFDSSLNPQDAYADPLAYALYKKAVKTCLFVERNGMPLDMDSLNEFNQELLEQELEIKKSLKDLPQVLQAVLAIPEVAEKQSKDKLTEELILKEISPTKAKFITNLCLQNGLESFGKETDKGISFTSKATINTIKNKLIEDRNEELLTIFDKLQFVGNSRLVRGKFVNNWKKYYVPEDGKLHPQYKLTRNQSLSYNSGGGDDDGGAQSGRLSCTNPNTQQIRKVAYLRKHFIAPEGYSWVEIDYSSLEPMLIAFVANCERLKEVFRRKLDIYLVTANDVYGAEHGFDVDMSLPDDEVRKLLKERVDPSFRDKLKIGFLAWCYGRSEKSFARDLNISLEEAGRFYEVARQMYSEIYNWKESIIDDIKQGELIRTLFGRKRSFPVLPMTSKKDRHRYNKDLAKAIRVAVNFPIQGLGSDILLWQADSIREWIIAEELQNIIIMSNLVHDAIWFLIRDDALPWAVPALQGKMEDISNLPFKMDVPLRTEADSGKTMADYMKKNLERKLIYKPYVLA